MGSEKALELLLTCSCTARLGRHLHDETFVLKAWMKAQKCSAHVAPLPVGVLVVGFGPYPQWDANVALKVQSMLEAGGMMEREHAFILDGQFLFINENGRPRPLGPILDAQWK